MLSWPRARAVLVAAFTLSSFARVLQASTPPSIELEYDVNPSLDCPGRAEFRQAIERELGYAPFTDKGSLRVIASVRPSPQGLEGIVAWASAHEKGDGGRWFVGVRGDCGALVRGMEFAIAVQLQLLGTPSDGASSSSNKGKAATARDTSAGVTSPDRSGRSGAEREGARAVPAAPIEGAPWHLLAGAGLLTQWGTSPAVAPGGRVFAEVDREVLSFELGIEASLASVWRNDDGSGFRARALLGTLAGCGHFGALSLCGLGKAGRLAVSGFGLDDAATSGGWLIQAGTRVVVSRPLGRYMVGSLHAELLGTPAPWTVVLNRLPVWTTPSIAALVGLDVAALLL